MGIKQAYEAYMQNQQRALQQGEREVKRVKSAMRPGLNYVHPVRMFGNLWYVGDTTVCAHLVDTGKGLLLFDSVDVGQGGMLVNAIWEAGFNPADIRWIVHSHGHFDHFGQAQFFKDMYGCQLGLSEPDARMFANRPELSYIQDSASPYEPLFTPDFVIHDGEVMDFGHTRVRFVMVPGHTEGCLAAFFDVTDGQQTLRAGYYGGFGFNTLQRDYLLDIGDTQFAMRQRYLESLQKVRHEHVDIMLGNHPDNNDTLGKIARLAQNPAVNPFIDREEWGRVLDQKRDRLLALMQDPAQN